MRNFYFSAKYNIVFFPLAGIKSPLPDSKIRNEPLRILYPLKFQFLFYVWGQKYSDMNKATILCLFTLLVALAASLKAQIPDPFPTLPLAPNRSPVFGKDIVINDQPDQSQQDVVICSAYNGWLFAAYWYQGPYKSEGMTATQPIVVIVRSKTNGMSWEKIGEYNWTLPSTWISRIDIATTGQSVAEMKLFVGFVQTNNQAPYQASSGYVLRFDAKNGAFEDFLFTNPAGIHTIDLAICSDVNSPAGNASPNSLAILVTQSNTWNSADSLTIYTSSDGGLTLDASKSIAGSPWSSKTFRTCSLSYAWSPTYNTGRYYAVWEMYSGFHQNNIMTAHSEPNFDSPFTPPVCLDSLSPQNIEMCRNPVIACQVSNSDNDSANITEVVVFEKFIEATNSWELAGCYNLQSTTSRYFQTFDITDNNDLLFQPDLAFNSENDSFYLTYYDSTGSKLPLLIQGVNMSNPNSWSTASSDYHDLFSLAAPRPKLGYSFEKEDVVMVWGAKQSNGNKVALFDAPYSTYTEISDIFLKNPRVVLVVPNPSTGEVNISFSLTNTEKVEIIIRNILGKPIQTICNQDFQEGNHTMTCNFSTLPSGEYLLQFSTASSTLSNKMIIVK